MRYQNFQTFIDKKKREALKQLNIIEKMLMTTGFRVQSFLNEGDNEDPYVFCYNPKRNTNFDGVRIYKIGNTIAFRIQKESETHPFGTAYSLDIEEMFEDLMSEEDMTEEKAGKKVIQSVAKEITSFFNKSEEAESKERQNSIIGDTGRVSIGSTTGTDYSSMIYSKS